MSTPTTTARRAQEIALEQIEAGGNVRELDAEHVTALAGSMAIRGLIVPIAVRPLDGERFALVAGEHRLAAAHEHPTYYGGAWVALGRLLLTTDLLQPCP